MIPSKYPYTTVTLYERTEPTTSRILFSATVGCLPTDSYSNERGRLYALRALHGFLVAANKRDPKQYGKDFRTALWRAYTQRGRQQNVIDGTVVRKEEGPQKALPPAPPTVADQNNLNERVIH
jgi:hypothetical protein